ncbi:hypothetical protein K458DRAFT_394796 [Lentithecium fluviatile CBS 122367]|uniref:Heterokaryon incompatibility domain-containing protein n=1 Tax=Lentithecium fluviatile CBS 122367 TaxID=1168545 RepID=A0A6G1IJW5_9PLEO|nr:hypothetical protein K458DRAFT_394796 [Lentithecium fluviatile CBS 122367]
MTLRSLGLDGKTIALSGLLILAFSVKQPLEATDPRDKIYALSGIAEDTESLNLKTDYSKTCEEVFVEVAISLLEKEGLDMLSIFHALRTTANLPSWVPNFSSRGLHFMLLGEGCQFMASCTDTLPLRFDDRGSVNCSLTLFGTRVDTIHEVLEPSPRPAAIREWSELFLWLDDIFDRTKHNSYTAKYPTPTAL